MARKISVLIAEINLEGQKIDYILNQIKKDHPEIVIVVLTAFKDKAVYPEHFLLLDKKAIK